MRPTSYSPVVAVQIQTICSLVLYGFFCSKLRAWFAFVSVELEIRRTKIPILMREEKYSLSSFLYSFVVVWISISAGWAVWTIYLRVVLFLGSTKKCLVLGLFITSDRQTDWWSLCLKSLKMYSTPKEARWNRFTSVVCLVDISRSLTISGQALFYALSDWRPETILSMNVCFGGAPVCLCVRRRDLEQTLFV